MPPPAYNYPLPFQKEKRPLLRLQKIGLKCAGKLPLNFSESNTEIHNTGYSDKGLLELKRAEEKARVRALWDHPWKEGVSRLPVRVVQVFFESLVLHATQGGTSLARLILGGIIFVPLYALLLSKSHVTFMGQDCYLYSFNASLVLQQIARAASLFLAIGYTAFSGGALATVLLTVGAASACSGMPL